MPARTILVVDDDETVRLVTVGMLEDLGFEVAEAENAERALDLLERRTDIALLLTDCRMPGVTGEELARIATQRWPRLKVVLTSGLADAVEPGPFALLQKPYAGADVARIVSSVLGA